MNKSNLKKLVVICVPFLCLGISLELLADTLSGVPLSTTVEATAIGQDPVETRELIRSLNSRLRGLLKQAKMEASKKYVGDKHDLKAEIDGLVLRIKELRQAREVELRRLGLLNWTPRFGLTVGLQANVPKHDVTDGSLPFIACEIPLTNMISIKGAYLNYGSYKWGASIQGNYYPLKKGRMRTLYVGSILGHEEFRSWENHGDWRLGTNYSSVEFASSTSVGLGVGYNLIFGRWLLSFEGTYRLHWLLVPSTGRNTGLTTNGTSMGLGWVF